MLGTDEIQDLAAGFTAPLMIIPVAPDCISIEHVGSDRIIRWGSGSILQSADEVAGPWGDVPNASSPYTVPLSSAAQFFRLRSP